ncbi:hypothetical protein evm_008425 [Chilo suppressalis]|nr:hypothetical protein evm_008425 [Chilo suppressalis]
MVWLGVSYWGLREVHFCEKGVRSNAVVYQNTVLMNLVEPVPHTMFDNRHWVLQQDSAPAHRAKSTQDWLAAREIDFIWHEDWSSSSPDMSPLDYKIWQHLEEKACSKPHPNLESLKTSLIKASADIDMDLIRAAIDDWPRRLKACIQNHGVFVLFSISQHSHQHYSDHEEIQTQSFPVPSKMQDHITILVILTSLLLLVESAIRCEYRKYLIPGNVYYLYSPGYPRDFATAVNCRWIVTTTPGFVCRLECLQFVLEENPSCSSDRFLVSNIGDSLFMTANLYCGKRSVTEVSLGPRISMTLQATTNTTGGRFLCQVSAEKQNLFENHSTFSVGRSNSKLDQPWFNTWFGSIREITSQLNFNQYFNK